MNFFVIRHRGIGHGPETAVGMLTPELWLFPVLCDHVSHLSHWRAEHFPAYGTRRPRSHLEAVFLFRFSLQTGKDVLLKLLGFVQPKKGYLVANRAVCKRLDIRLALDYVQGELERILVTLVSAVRTDIMPTAAVDSLEVLAVGGFGLGTLVTERTLDGSLGPGSSLCGLLARFLLDLGFRLSTPFPLDHEAVVVEVFLSLPLGGFVGLRLRFRLGLVLE